VHHLSHEGMNLTIPLGEGSASQIVVDVDGQSTTFPVAYRAPSISTISQATFGTLGGLVTITGSSLAIGAAPAVLRRW
jgi:hypothetical protein